MTSERGQAGPKPGFPVGLTLAAAVVFMVCGALGVWQLRRADWKAQELARIALLRRAPPVPIGPVLARAAAREDVSFTRVLAGCAPGPEAPAQLRMVSDNGEWIARTLGVCRLAGGPFDGVVVDRGFLQASRGSPNPAAPVLAPPGRVVGVLYAHAEPAARGLPRPAPYVLVAERETPAAPGIAPAAYPDAAANLQYVGLYAPTWFGLAGVVACVYAAMLWRRTHPKPLPRR
jgi:surfeit locus 1 family protein